MAAELTEEDNAIAPLKRGRKRYICSPQFLQSEARSSDSTINAYALSTEGHERPLQDLQGESLYREVDKKETASKCPFISKYSIVRVIKALPQPIRKALSHPHTWAQWKKFAFARLPVLDWVYSYRPKQLIGDVLAGITIGLTHIEQGIGLALLANLLPIFGLYSSFVPVLLYSIFGSSRHISVGTFAVVAVMVGNVITRERHSYGCSEDGGSGGSGLDLRGSDSDMTRCESLGVDIAVTLSLMVGVIMLLMSLLRLGFITIFLSDALISGFIAASAFAITVDEIPFIFGLDEELVAVEPGLGTTPKRIIAFSRNIFFGKVNGAAIVTFVICVIILLSLDALNYVIQRCSTKISIHVPAQLIVVILTPGIAGAANLSDRFGLPVIQALGEEPVIAYRSIITIPKLDLVQDLIEDAIVIAVLSFVFNILQVNLLAKKHHYSVSPNQELLAYGMMNFGGSFFGSFPTAGSLTRTILQDATGGNTQLVGFISSFLVFIVLFVISVAGNILQNLPQAAVAAIVVTDLKDLYYHVKDIYKYHMLSLYTDLVVWLVVFLSAFLIGLDIGLWIGILFSLFLIILRTVLPFSPELGETRAWHFPPEEKLADEDLDKEDLKVHTVSNIYIFQFNAPLYYANVAIFRERLYTETGIYPSQLKEPEWGCCRKRAAEANEPAVDFSDGQYLRLDDDTDTQSLVPEVETPSALRYHTIILDCSPIAFVDSTALTAVEQLVREFDSVGIQVLLAAPLTPVCKALQKFGFFKRYSSERLFPTVGSAVRYAKDKNRVPTLEQPKNPDNLLLSYLEMKLLYTARPSLLEVKPVSRNRTTTLTPPSVMESTV